MELSHNLNEVKGIGDVRVPISIHAVDLKINGRVFEMPLAIALIEKIPYI